MTIAAESFAGRVLAVFSRRSPGFRPPLVTSGLRMPHSLARPLPAADRDVPGPPSLPRANTPEDAWRRRPLAYATARWKTAAPQRRLQYRSDISVCADNVQAAAEILVLTRARALALVLDHSLALARDSVRADGPGLSHAFDRANDLAADLASVIGLASDHDLARNLDLARDRARNLASGLASTRDLIRNLDLTRNRDLASDLGLDRTCDRARDLASDLASDLGLVLTRALALANDLASDLVLDFVRDLAGARSLNHLSGLALDHALDRASYLARDLARGLAATVVLDLDLDLDLARDLNVDSAGLPIPTLTRARALDEDLALALDRDPAFDRDLNLALDLIEARDNLTEAANSFVGADLTTVRPDEISLAGIRWDSSTQWPTPEWEARMRAASVEDPPGSGVFVVLPEEGHHSADSGSLVPIS